MEPSVALRWLIGTLQSDVVPATESAPPTEFADEHDNIIEIVPEIPTPNLTIKSHRKSRQGGS
jgi:hypothetical protein